MCLAVPAKILEIHGDTAVVDIGGNRRQADLTLLPAALVGEYVLMHAGFAIGKYDEETALAVLQELENIVEAMNPEEMC